MSSRVRDVPYDRETFMYKQLLIDFDANFNQIEANELAFLPQAKNWAALANFIDSMNLQIDSAALASSSDYAGRALPTTKAFTRKDSLATLRALSHVKLNFDSLVAKNSQRENGARTQPHRLHAPKFFHRNDVAQRGCGRSGILRP